jgi:carboxymethylenebutenolidase
MQESLEEVEVEAGRVPIHVLSPEIRSAAPGLVVVPSIFGPAPDLLEQLAELADTALIVVPDPFWQVGGGVIPYHDHETAIGRLGSGFDGKRSFAEMRMVVEWTRGQCNGHVAGLGICFGGPFVLDMAGRALLDGVITWHGSRMQDYLARAATTKCPMRLHFGSVDPITPAEAIEQVRAAFAQHTDVEIVVHPGLDHGFSHAGKSYDATAARAGLDSVRSILDGLVRAVRDGLSQ